MESTAQARLLAWVHASRPACHNLLGRLPGRLLLPRLQELVRECLSPEPEQRPTFEQILARVLAQIKAAKLAAGGGSG